MEENKLKVGFAFTGSFCTLKKAINAMEEISLIYDIYPIMSHNVYYTDTRFGKAEDFKTLVKNITKKERRFDLNLLLFCFYAFSSRVFRCCPKATARIICYGLHR